jgi:hypothetical protein
MTAGTTTTALAPKSGATPTRRSLRQQRLTSHVSVEPVSVLDRAKGSNLED